MATVRSSRVSRARNTSPKPPAPDARDDLVGPETASSGDRCHGIARSWQTKALRQWLGDRDSNPDSAVQSRLSYH